MDNNLPYVAPIKLSREHTPIHPDCLIKNQQQYDYHISMLNFLNSQLDAGFKPKWMITTHLYHPREDYRNVPEMYSFKGGIPKTRWGRKTPLPNKFNRQSSLWDETPKHNYYDKRRNDEFETCSNNEAVKVSILNHLFGIKRGNQTWKIPPMLFFYEKGKVNLQYHIHILIPECKYDSQEDIAYVLNSIVRDKVRCISNWKTIDVKPIDNPKAAVSYLNKETDATHTSLDYQSSTLLT